MPLRMLIDYTFVYGRKFSPNGKRVRTLISEKQSKSHTLKSKRCSFIAFYPATKNCIGLLQSPPGCAQPF